MNEVKTFVLFDFIMTIENYLTIPEIATHFHARMLEWLLSRVPAMLQTSQYIFNLVLFPLTRNSISGRPRCAAIDACCACCTCYCAVKATICGAHISVIKHIMNAQ